MHRHGLQYFLLFALIIMGCQKRNAAPDATSFRWEYDGYARDADSSFAALKNTYPCGYPCSAIFMYKDCATGDDSSVFMWIPLPSFQPGVYRHPRYSTENYNVQYSVGDYGTVSARPMFTGGSVTVDRFDSAFVSGHFELVDWHGRPVTGRFNNLPVRAWGR